MYKTQIGCHVIDHQVEKAIKIFYLAGTSFMALHFLDSPFNIRLTNKNDQNAQKYRFGLFSATQAVDSVEHYQTKKEDEKSQKIDLSLSLNMTNWRDWLYFMWFIAFFSSFFVGVTKLSWGMLTWDSFTIKAKRNDFSNRYIDQKFDKKVNSKQYRCQNRQVN